MDPILSTKMDGLVVANLLKQKVGYHGILFEYKMIRVEPYSKLPFIYLFPCQKNNRTISKEQ